MKKYPELISPTPLIALANALRAEVNHIRRRTPNNDVANALESVSNDMEAAMNEAATVDVWLTVQQVAARTHRPASTITRICREEGANAGASKVKGAWSINWLKFEKYLRRGDSHQQEAA